MNKQEQLLSLEQKMREASLPLKDTALNLVFGDGSFDAKVFFVGEAPGKNEDEQGKPFVGAAGKNLNELLESISVDRNEVYITSILKYRPPKNRVPSKAEILAHTPFLIEQVKIIQPKVIATLGNYATKFVLNNFSVEGMDKVEGIASIHGQAKEVVLDSKKFTVIPLYHPAALLYQRSLKQAMWSDFEKIREMI